MKVQVFIMKVQAFIMIQAIAVLQVQCSAFASANVPLLSKSQTLRKTLEGGSSVVKIRRQVLHILCSNPRT
jgi:hypothetical protein